MKWAKEVCFRSQHRESPGTVLVPHPVQCDVIETGDRTPDRLPENGRVAQDSPRDLS